MEDLDTHPSRFDRPDRFRLSTREAMGFSGITRSALRYYIDKGVVVPLAANAIDEDKRKLQEWDRSQTETLQLAHSLSMNGTTLAQVAGVATEGFEGLLDSAYLEAANAMRRNRRLIKAIVNQKRQSERFRAAGAVKDFYIRYLPQRWLSLIPVSEGHVAAVDRNAYIEKALALKEVVEVVGWSRALSPEVVHSVSANEETETRFAAYELASPPMPMVTEGFVVDGGCYRGVNGSGNLRCDGLRCQECARFGRSPSSKEESSWKRAELTGKVLDRTVLADEVAEPYPVGIWHPYTDELLRKRRAAGSADDGRRGADDGQRGADDGAGKAGSADAGANGGGGEAPGNGYRKTLPAGRPRLMPQENRLPLGVTACELPAGFYLCRQGTYRNEEAMLQRLVGALSAIPQRPMSAEDEVRIASETARRSEEASPKRQPGPFIEPFASPRDFGDPTMFGFAKPILQSDFSKLVLPTATAFPPEDGYLIIQANIPTDAQSADAQFEFQVLLDA